MWTAQWGHEDVARVRSQSVDNFRGARRKSRGFGEMPVEQLLNLVRDLATAQDAAGLDAGV
jgi:hypothetical protein